VREAKAAPALNHPNIVTIYDVDPVDGIDFIAMEFIEGGTLDALLSAAPACAWRKRSAMLPKSRTPPPPLTRTASSTGT
ncbi:MAG: hypothetical protein HYR60_27705, partial [Acidobacteria bacterium]|nr:hypothetical protein [Acidobacteriota bacterium]